MHKAYIRWALPVPGEIYRNVDYDLRTHKIRSVFYMIFTCLKNLSLNIFLLSLGADAALGATATCEK